MLGCMGFELLISSQFSLKLVLLQYV